MLPTGRSEGMASKTVGYVVITLGSLSYANRDGVLFVAYGPQPGTVFETRRQAQRAIQRTLTYSTECGSGWKLEQYRIVRLARQS